MQCMSFVIVCEIRGESKGERGVEMCQVGYFSCSHTLSRSHIRCVSPLSESVRLNRLADPLYVSFNEERSLMNEFDAMNSFIQAQHIILDSNT